MDNYQNSMHPIAGDEAFQIRSLNAYIAKVYGWMFIGLSITAVTAFLFVADESRVMGFVGNPVLFFGTLIAQFAVVIIASRSIMKLSLTAGAALLGIYAVLNGLTLSVILLVYTGSSIATTFGITAVMFGVMSVYGKTTQTDLSRFRGMLTMGLIGIIVLSVANMFLRSGALDWVVTLVGLFVFLGLTAYDMQKLKAYYAMSQGDSLMQNRLGLLGALSLYLDFINLFLMLLRLFGRRR